MWHHVANIINRQKHHSAHPVCCEEAVWLAASLHIRSYSSVRAAVPAHASAAAPTAVTTRQRVCCHGVVQRQHVKNKWNYWKKYRGATSSSTGSVKKNTSHASLCLYLQCTWRGRTGKNRKISLWWLKIYLSLHVVQCMGNTVTVICCHHMLWRNDNSPSSTWCIYISK